MISTKQPKVILFNHTPMPMKSVALPVSAWTSDNFFESLGEISDEQAAENVSRALKAFHKVSLEFIDMIWIIKNVSRAFQQQLTRTRLASYSIQSLRVVTKKKFAESGHYTMPPSLDDKQKEFFHKCMLDIQYKYEALLDAGVKQEDARGILPLNVHSDISMRINMAALYNMTKQRLCVNTQWEYRIVTLQMKEAIKNKIGKVFSDLIDAPCININKCPMREEYCGIPFWKYGEKERIDMYERYINFTKSGRDWIIKWQNDEEPSYLMKDYKSV